MVDLLNGGVSLAGWKPRNWLGRPEMLPRLVKEPMAKEAYPFLFPLLLVAVLCSHSD